MPRQSDLRFTFMQRQGRGSGHALSMPGNPASGEEAGDAFHLTFSGDA